jgi:Zn-dependent M28 family amino/carboxypeptidase
MFGMPGRSHRGPLPALTEAERVLQDRLRGHVEEFAGRIGERSLRRPRALEAAARYVEEALSAAGLEPRPEPFTVNGEAVRNVVAETRGGADAEIVLLGAHYDTVAGCPGADDNATGVAALIEIARACAGRPLPRAVRFVGFVNEEPPFFQTAAMGSLRHARAARERRERIVAMLSLETIGYYADIAGSQEYPFPLGTFYPDRGDFLAFVGNLRSARLVRRAVASFRRHAAFPSEGLAAPEFLPGVGWSDQWAFWQAGYPAAMVTDTAPFRYPHYHLASDTADRIDGERLARVVAGLGRVTLDLAGAEIETGAMLS